ncbi:hypothetical protein GALMADRAFT_248100 [Galerina marginata CBS 339.88]|uniref:Uncharacterized protein n=1 Tax=Galerina marginata (strain CBS 339.88) TaxID=685588 RepID=A0A067T9C1_GALM3|nr:hypothetical protein GALMADRAFT_248100 [Galerina marginata CBS 339.88]
MAHDFSVFDRPDLNVRMTSRRRLPHRSATATPSTQNGFGPNPVTYSAFLGMFDQASSPVANGNGPYLRHPSRSPTENGFSFHPFDPPGPSRAHSSTYQGFQSPPSDVESGWTKDVLGRDQWIGHAKIDDDEDDAAAAVSVNLGEDDETDNLATPPPRSTVRLSWPSTDRHTNGHGQDAIPLNSTPPPCPRPRKLPSLRETTSGSDNHSFKPTSASTPAMAPPTIAGPSSSTAIDDPIEVALVKENLELLATCTEDVKVMETYFFVHPIELSTHIDLCSKLQDALRSLHNTLTHRAKMGAEEWHVRSSAWHHKYAKRLLSLRTTLQRLSRMRELIENQPLRPRQRLAIQTKLEQHEAKLGDLASKYTVAFDRLRLRHLHFLLTQSTMKAKQQKAQKTRLMSRASFEREWTDGKALRATLRHAFHDLRQEYYNSSSRSARHTYAP